MLRWLETNGASEFAKLIRKMPSLLSLMGKSLVILAPNDAAIGRLQAKIGKLSDSNIQLPAIVEIFSNHFSTGPWRADYPMFKSITGFGFGAAPLDFKQLGVQQKAKIGQTDLAVIGVILIDNNQLVAASTSSLVRYDPRTVKSRKFRAWICGKGIYGQLSFGDQKDRRVPTLNPKLQGIVQAVGEYHTLFLDNQGRVLGCGHNDDGQLGLGQQSGLVLNPRLIPNLSGIIQIACGRRHSLFLDNQGHVWACGTGPEGQLGLGKDKIEVSTPTLIPELHDIASMASGRYHNAFITKNGHVFVCGTNLDGQLGLGIGDEKVFIPIQISNLEGVVQAACGEDHTVFLDRQGRVFVCGSGGHAQLGLGEDMDTSISTPSQIPELNNIIQVAAARTFTLFLDNRGHVWVCGHGPEGQLGLGRDLQYGHYSPTLIPNLEGVIQIACSIYHSLFLKKDGKVLGCGKNQYNQLGLPSNTMLYIFPTDIPNLQGIVSMACGPEHSIFLD